MSGNLGETAQTTEPSQIRIDEITASESRRCINRFGTSDCLQWDRGPALGMRPKGYTFRYRVRKVFLKGHPICTRLERSILENRGGDSRVDSDPKR